MRVRVYGEDREVAADATLEDLLEQMDLDRRYLVIEYNGEPLPRERFGDLRLAEGDNLELVRPVAGG